VPYPPLHHHHSQPVPPQMKPCRQCATGRSSVDQRAFPIKALARGHIGGNRYRLNS
jgi:hypothetical protein